MCLVQHHCDVSAGFTLSPVCLRCCKNTREEASTGLCGGRQSFFVTTTAGEGETSGGNPGNSNGDAVDVAPPVPAPEDEAAMELAAAESAPRGPVVHWSYMST